MRLILPWVILASALMQSCAGIQLNDVPDAIYPGARSRTEVGDCLYGAFAQSMAWPLDRLTYTKSDTAGLSVVSAMPPRGDTSAGPIIVFKIESRGAGSVTSLFKAKNVVEIAAGTQSIERFAGDAVRVCGLD